MPSPRRLFFAFAAKGAKVSVVGGHEPHDDEKNALLRSATAYDAWVPLPGMTRERDEAKGVCVGDRLVVLRGYPTEAQGEFSGSGEVFDPVAWAWGAVQELMLCSVFPRTCCVPRPGREAGSRMYMVRDGHVVSRDPDGETWRPVARVPEDARGLLPLQACSH